MTTTDRISRITGTETPAHISDNVDDHLTAWTGVEPWQAHDVAVDALADLNRIFRRWYRWFAACKAFDADRDPEGGPKGRRPSEKSGDFMYDQAHRLRTALVTAGATDVPGRPMTMDGLDVVIAYAHRYLDLPRKALR
jgi:hypothetical protein